MVQMKKFSSIIVKILINLKKSTKLRILQYYKYYNLNVNLLNLLYK